MEIGDLILNSGGNVVSRRAKTTLVEKTAWLLASKTYYKNTVINTVWYWHEDSRINSWHSIEAKNITHLYEVTRFAGTFHRKSVSEQMLR